MGIEGDRGHRVEDEEKRTPAAQSNLGSALIGAAAGVVGTPVLNGLYSYFFPKGLPIPLPYLVLFGVVLALVLISIIGKRPRRLVWGSFRTFVVWFFTIRWFTTRKQKQALVDSGYEKRSSEVENERATARKPDFRIREKSRGLYVLYNEGWWVKDVRLSAPGDEFEFDTVPSWSKEQFGDDATGSHPGKTFDGKPTAKGRASGVTFRVDWLDRNGDPDHIEILFTPPPPPKIVRAVWEVGPHAKRDGFWVLVNHAAGSVAKRVHLEPVGSHLVVMRSAADWDEIRGGEAEVFAAKVLDGARMLGGEFLITWLDENGDENDEMFHVPALGAGFGMF